MEPVEHPSGDGESVAAPTPAGPDRIGKYRVAGLIGQGAMGVVYKGYDEQIERPVAIKTVRLDLLDDIDRDALLERFGREARAAGRCLHPNIVTVFDYVEQDGAPYIVMEFVEAGTLDNVIRSRARIPLRQVGEIMSQLLFALGCAHERGVIHRDVKPNNVLCPSPASIKVTDFGVARLDALGATNPGLGGVGAIGTPNYMSPEQFFGRHIDRRSDLFSAGVILYQLLTGERPFPAEDLEELKERLLSGEPVPPRNHRPELPQELNDVALRALARDPDDRFQNHEAFIDALTAAIDAGAVDDNEVALDLTKFAATEESSSGAPMIAWTLAETLHSDTIDRLKSSLARHLGPIAGRLLDKACKEASTPQELLDTLSAAIPTDHEAAAFRVRAEETLRGDTGITAIQADKTIPEMEVRRAEELLTVHIGPVAAVLTKRVAKSALGVEDFYERLEKWIPDPKAQAMFRRSRTSS